MLVTAIVKDNNLIIPNIDVSQLPNQPNEFGMVQLDLSYLNNPIKIDKPLLNNIDKKRKKLTVDEMLQKMTFQTDKHATVEEMNESIAKAYENWEV